MLEIYHLLHYGLLSSAPWFFYRGKLLFLLTLIQRTSLCRLFDGKHTLPVKSTYFQIRTVHIKVLFLPQLLDPKSRSYSCNSPLGAKCRHFRVFCYKHRYSHLCLEVKYKQNWFCVMDLKDEFCSYGPVYKIEASCTERLEIKNRITRTVLFTSIKQA